MTGWNLPPGCTTADIDRHFGADVPEIECEWCGHVWYADGYPEDADVICEKCRELTDSPDALLLGQDAWVKAEPRDKHYSVYCFKHPEHDEEKLPYYYEIETPYSSYTAQHFAATDREAEDRLIFYLERALRNAKPYKMGSTFADDWRDD